MKIWKKYLLNKKKKKQNKLIKNYSSYSEDEEDSDSNESESDNSDNDGSDEKLNKKRSKLKLTNNSKKQVLIYENSYLFKHKKKDILIKDEIYKILNNKYDEKENKSEEEESESISSGESKKKIMIEYRNKFSKKNYLSKRKSLRIKKNKNKKKVNKISLLDKMSLDYTSGEIKDKTDINKHKNIDGIYENQHLENRLKYFFSNIQRLKNTKDEDTIEKLMKELGVYDIEKGRKLNLDFDILLIFL